MTHVSIEVVSLKKHKQSVRITVGQTKKITFEMMGNITERAAKRLEFTLPTSNKKIQYEIFGSDGHMRFRPYPDEKSFNTSFGKILGFERFLGSSLFPSNNRDQAFDVSIENTPHDSRNPWSDATARLERVLKRNWIVFPWSFPTPPQSNPLEKMEFQELGQMLSASLWVAILYDISEPNALVFSPPLPSIEELVPVRKVDLHPFELMGDIATAGLYYDQTAITSLAMALNSGQHVILTGPPGSGKTELARQISKMTYQHRYLLCTASPDWTTNELIGRYMPVADKNRDAALEFQPGFFLQAIENGDWLIIDELNRADIDNCMGPLFSVLSGHEVVLPYKTNKNSKTNVDSKKIGICMEEDFESLNKRDDIHWYKVPGDFRIICTMNDSDAGQLNQLSYALQRRFSVIRVESPAYTSVQKYIGDQSGGQVCKVYEEYSKAGRSFPSGDCLNKEAIVASISQNLKALFAKNDGGDLMQLRIVGFGQIKDIITMVIEGLSSPYGYHYDTDRAKVQALILTLLATGMVMKVFPQLPAFAHNHNGIDGNVLEKVFKCIVDLFKEHKYYALASSDGEKQLEIKPSPNAFDLLSYLENELGLLFRNQNVDWKNAWDKTKHDLKSTSDDSGQE